MKYCSQCWGLPTTLELRGYFPVTWEFLGEDIIFQISFALPWHSSVCVCVCVHAQSLCVSDSSQPHGLQPAIFLCPWDSPGKNTGVRSHFLLQRIFPTQGSNTRLMHFLHRQPNSLPPPGKPSNGTGRKKKKGTDHETQEKRPMPGNPKTSLGSKGCFRGGRTSEISVILFLWHCSTNLERSGETLGVYSMKFTTYKYKFGIRKRD